ncbi:hypothetical protein KIPB_012823, partial [Kipferlia bialata]|eukprot:g12823.t1
MSTESVVPSTQTGGPSGTGAARPPAGVRMRSRDSGATSKSTSTNIAAKAAATAK